MKKIPTIFVAMMYLTNPLVRDSLGPRDRPDAAYFLAAFFAFFFGAACGFGGVLSNLRSTSSGLGGGRSWFMGLGV